MVGDVAFQYTSQLKHWIEETQWLWSPEENIYVALSSVLKDKAVKYANS